MTTNMGIDQNKLALVRLCLENAGFRDIRTKEIQEVFRSQIFAFNDGKKTYELKYVRSYIDDNDESKLKKELESRIIPKLKENADKQISVSNEGLQVRNRDSA